MQYAVTIKPPSLDTDEEHHKIHKEIDNGAA